PTHILHSINSHTTYFLHFSFPHPSTTYLYTLSLHDALPIFPSYANAPLPTQEQMRRARDSRLVEFDREESMCVTRGKTNLHHQTDRKSTRLNSSHVAISYAVFCLKKKKQTKNTK